MKPCNRFSINAVKSPQQISNFFCQPLSRRLRTRQDCTWNRMFQPLREKEREKLEKNSENVKKIQKIKQKLE